MKIKKLVFLISILLIISFLVWFSVAFFLKNPNSHLSFPERILSLQITEEDSCFYKPSYYMTFSDGRKMYTYCLEDISVQTNKTTKPLKEYLEENEENLDNLLSFYKHQDTLLDGGTEIKKINDSTIISCHTLNGVNDIYIGPSNMTFKENFCKKDNTTFIRTYLIKDIKEYLLQQYEGKIPVSYSNSYQVTLTDGTLEDTVIINNLETELVIGENYEFEFQVTKSIDDTIQSIFQNAIIIDIRKTERQDYQQIQEEIQEAAS